MSFHSFHSTAFFPQTDWGVNLATTELVVLTGWFFYVADKSRVQEEAHWVQLYLVLPDSSLEWWLHTPHHFSIKANMLLSAVMRDNTGPQVQTMWDDAVGKKQVCKKVQHLPQYIHPAHTDLALLGFLSYSRLCFHKQLKQLRQVWPRSPLPRDSLHQLQPRCYRVTVVPCQRQRDSCLNGTMSLKDTNLYSDL